LGAIAAAVAIAAFTGACSPPLEERDVASAAAPSVTCDADRDGARLIPASGIWYGVNLDLEHDAIPA